MVFTGDYMNYSTRIKFFRPDLILILALLLTSCIGEERKHSDPVNRIHEPIVEATSLFGAGLVRPDFDQTSEDVLTSELERAVLDYDGSPESMVWIARRTAAMWRFQDAVVVLTDALEEFNDHPQLLRYRGQYLLILREFEIARQDLAKVRLQLNTLTDYDEPDAPDGTVIQPASTFYFAIWYYSGLVYYMKGNFEQAYEAFNQAGLVAANMDAYITAADWTIMSLIQAHRNTEAKALLNRLERSVTVTDATSYLERLRLMADPDYHPDLKDIDIFDQVTITYGLAMRARMLGNNQEYLSYLQQILDTNIWSAVSYIAAEADLFRNSQASL